MKRSAAFAQAQHLSFTTPSITFTSTVQRIATSNAPARCCAVGVKETGEASGQLTTLGAYPACITKPTKATGKSVLIIPNILEHEFPNAQLVADSFAENGYTTVIPDVFHGDPVSLNLPTMRLKELWGK